MRLRLALATILTLVAGGTSASAQTPGNGIIAFSTFGGTPQQSSIYTIPARGGDPTLLVVGSLPAWAPSGQVLAYASGGGDVFAVGADGSNPHQLVADATAPAYSHDGTRLAYVKDGSVWISDPDGTRPRLLLRARGGWTVHRIAWSPDDRRLAYLYFGPDSAALLNVQMQVRVLKVAAPARRPIVAYREPQTVGMWYSEGNSLAWQPDGDTLALSMVSPNARSSATGLVSATGRGPVRRVGRGTFGASWAPNGKALCVSGPRGLAIVNAHFRAMRTIQRNSTSLSATGSACAWQPLG